MYNWRKGIAQWRIKDTLYLSIVFTWDLPEARKIAEASKKHVIVGGPAVSLMPDYLADVAEIGKSLPYSPLSFHNPMATFTSRGCPNKCGFCAVHRIEPDFIEYDDFLIRPVVCDNNLLACSDRHFDRVIDQLKVLPFVDFNQGLEAARFASYHAERIAEIRHAKVRFSLDSWEDQGDVYHAVCRCRWNGIKDIGIYVLIGYDDTPEEAKEKLEWVRSLKIMPNPMRYQPLDLLVKNAYIGEGWTKKELEDVQRYYSRLGYFGGGISFEQYRYGNYDYVNQGSLKGII